MKDFDIDRAASREREQGFKIGGEEFRVRTGVHPSVFSDYENREVTGRDSVLEAFDLLISEFLWDDEHRKRWADLRKRTDETSPTMGELRAVIAYLYEVESELPTSAPESSGVGRGTTRRRSAAGTSSTEETAS